MTSAATPKGPAGPAAGRVVDVRGDGKLLKTVVVAGSGRPHAAAASPAAAVLSYRLLPLEEAPDAAQPPAPTTAFVFGRPEPTEGFAAVLTSMREGEHATVILLAEAPPDQRGRTLYVHLLRWAPALDLSPEKDGTIVKVTLTEGTADEVYFRSRLTCRWTLRPLNAPEVLEEHAALPLLHEVDALPCGLSVAIAAMRRGERAVVQLLTPAACAVQHPSCAVRAPVPPAEYDLTVLTAEDPVPFHALSFADRLALALQLKDEGNQLLAEEKVDPCVKTYQLALSYLQEPPPEGPLPAAYEGAIVQLHLNIAAVAIKMGRWKMAAQETQLVLALQPDHPKALLRRGKALVELGMEEEGVASLARVAALPAAAPTETAAARSELEKAAKRLRKRVPKASAAERPHLQTALRRIADALDHGPDAAPVPAAASPVGCAYCKQPGHLAGECPGMRADEEPRLTEAEAAQVMRQLVEQQRQLKAQLQYHSLQAQNRKMKGEQERE